MQACLPVVMMEITDKDCMHITGSERRRKLRRKMFLQGVRKEDIVNESKNHPASAAVADDIDFGGGIAFS